VDNCVWLPGTGTGIAGGGIVSTITGNVEAVPTYIDESEYGEDATCVDYTITNSTCAAKYTGTLAAP
jgi:hypothetical protein